MGGGFVAPQNAATQRQTLVKQYIAARAPCFEPHQSLEPCYHFRTKSRRDEREPQSRIFGVHHTHARAARHIVPVVVLPLSSVGEPVPDRSLWCLDRSLEQVGRLRAAV